MGMVIGIDVGGSTTKIIGVDGEGIKHPMIVKATDPITSLFGAFGKYIYDNNISLSGIEKVMLTGVGSAYVNQPLYGLPTEHTDEFLANGLGAHYGSAQELLSSKWRTERFNISAASVSVEEPFRDYPDYC